MHVGYVRFLCAEVEKSKSRQKIDKQIETAITLRNIANNVQIVNVNTTI